jgi:MoaA/NifB/PqqE/SkfB family radical SAM enzyme/GT2 family glycosyltransferase
MSCCESIRFRSARTPRILWIELTSKCPFDCVFCSRKTRRGSGQHLPYPVYESLVKQLADPRKLILNYSGESTCYPEIIAAIELARSTGAIVELVSALASVPETLLHALASSGLTRLTVSIHATDPEKYKEIYRYGSFEELRSRLERFLAISRGRPNPTIVDLAFVAMDRNLAELASVAAFAESLGIGNILIFPVLRRDEIPVHFPQELTALGELHQDFQRRLGATVDDVRRAHPHVQLAFGNPSLSVTNTCLGQTPVPYPAPLPAGARIHSCEQNPWETAHILANGDVVACEVLDKAPLGNLLENSIEEIWRGEAYERFRDRYHLGEDASCRICPWKEAYSPSPLESEILGARGRSAQLAYGWHENSNEQHIWSSQQAMAVLAPHPDSRAIHVSGILPPGPSGEPSELTIRCGGVEIGTVTNPWDEVLPFGLTFAVDQPGDGPWWIDFRTRGVFRPNERGFGSDQRDLGFALVLLTSLRFEDPEVTRRQGGELSRLRSRIAQVDRLGKSMGWLRRGAAKAHSFAPGITIVIPERDNLEELAVCLESLQAACEAINEPRQIIIVVNGAAPSRYRPLIRAHPDFEWQFHTQPLSFARAIAAGLRKARFDWVYLLNNDVALAPGALRNALLLRSPDVFAIASQIFFKDATRFREETNLTSLLLLEDGLATVHDQIPHSADVTETFYAGGGASLFQRRLLRTVLDPSAYAPFYWEDVEWGWRARKLGYRNLFCPQSVVHHRQRATISRHYAASEIETIVERNRYLFQLRNFTAAGSLENLLDRIARSPHAVASFFSDRGTHWRVAQGRLWNHLAPISDDEVLARWTNSLPSGSISTC